MTFEQFIEKHKEDYTFAQKSSLDALLNKMKDEQGTRRLEESKGRLNSGDFDILDVEHDLKYGRKDLNKG